MPPKKQARREDHVVEFSPRDNTTHADRRMDSTIASSQVQQLRLQRLSQQPRQQWFEDKVHTKGFDLEKEYSTSDDEFVAEKEEDRVLFLYGDDEL
ncbi:hypothetical protein Syun_010081 [Stephania yunnanensis]|uniref:Uncharacterized protein n=1 Tax=Stephania yunnanensis TaxID=152371 RepID=A0AAP0KI77_9MAGN